jgi:hypothetical protein
MAKFWLKVQLLSIAFELVRKLMPPPYLASLRMMVQLIILGEALSQLIPAP